MSAFHLTPKQFLAQTERNIQAIEKAVFQATAAIQARFDGVDGCICRDAQDLMDYLEEWAASVRTYANACVKDGAWSSKKFEDMEARA